MNNHGESLGYSFNCCAVRMYLPERDNGVILSAIYNCVICSQAMIKFMLVIGCIHASKYMLWKWSFVWCGNHTVATTLWLPLSALNPAKTFPRSGLLTSPPEPSSSSWKKRKSTWIKFFMLTEKLNMTKKIAYMWLSKIMNLVLYAWHLIINFVLMSVANKSWV